MLSGILNPQWSDDGDFEVQLLEWEHKVDKYTNVTQVQVPDSIKCATVMRWAPTSVRDYLHRSPIDVMTNYGVLRSQLVLYFTKARTYDNLGNITNEDESKAVAKTPTPVLSTLQEVLAMFKGKGKGKDGQKGKGGSKDEGTSNTWQWQWAWQPASPRPYQQPTTRYCCKCGGAGHLAANCATQVYSNRTCHHCGQQGHIATN